MPNHQGQWLARFVYDERDYDAEDFTIEHTAFKDTRKPYDVSVDVRDGENCAIDWQVGLDIQGGRSLHGCANMSCAAVAGLKMPIVDAPLTMPFSHPNHANITGWDQTDKDAKKERLKQRRELAKKARFEPFPAHAYQRRDLRYKGLSFVVYVIFPDAQAAAESPLISQLEKQGISAMPVKPDAGCGYDSAYRRGCGKFVSGGSAFAILIDARKCVPEKMPGVIDRLSGHSTGGATLVVARGRGVHLLTRLSANRIVNVDSGDARSERLLMSEACRLDCIVEVMSEQGKFSRWYPVGRYLKMHLESLSRLAGLAFTLNWMRYKFHVLQFLLIREGWRSYTQLNGGKWQRVKLPQGRWQYTFCADPFLFRHQDANWLFFETMTEDSNKGIIGCMKEAEGKWVWQGIALEEPWHLSYPQVFEENGKIYMIPESCRRGTGDVRLYEAEDFPLKWRMVKVLIDRPLADSTLLRQDGRYYLACYRVAPDLGAELWQAESLEGPWRQHPMSGAVNQSRRLRRCGGHWLSRGGKVYRVAQDCNGFYGKRLFAVPVEKLTSDCYCEGRAEVLIDAAAKPYGRKHTYNEIETPEGKLVVVDIHHDVTVFKRVGRAIAKKVGLG